MRKLMLFSFVLAVACGIGMIGSENIQAQGPPPHHPAPGYRRPAPPRRYAPPPAPPHYAPPPPPHYAPPPPPPPAPTWGGVIGDIIDAAIIESRRP